MQKVCRCSVLWERGSEDLLIARVGVFDAARLQHEDVVAPHTTPSVTRDHVNAETGTWFDVLQVFNFAFHRERTCPGAQIENMDAGLLWQTGCFVVKAETLRFAVHDRLNIVPAVVDLQTPEIVADVICKGLE